LNDGSIVACGSLPVDFPHHSSWILKVSSDSDSLWYRQYDNLYGYASENYLNDIMPTSDNGFLACGKVVPRFPDTGIQDAWLIMLDSMGCDSPGCAIGVGIIPPLHSESDTRNLIIFPNPANNEINCQLSIVNCQLSMFIYDLYGRNKDQIIIPKGQTQTRVDISTYPAGVYLAVLKDKNGFVARGKFVKR
jgi:hypothetical protein